MPTRNHGQGQQGRANEETTRGVGEKIQGMGEQIQQGAAQVGQRLRENYDSASSEVARRYRGAEGMMARNPAPSVLIGFGIGFGLGLVLTSMLAKPEPTWAEKHLPDSLRNAPDTIHTLAESIARRLPSHLRHS